MEKIFTGGTLKKLLKSFIWNVIFLLSSYFENESNIAINNYYFKIYYHL